jgi:aerobic-type carbon monoxide dehydrogenase small subunit (CoxS/CutS family)
MNDQSEMMAQAQAPQTIRLNLNGNAVDVLTAPSKRLSDVLRDDLGLTGTKIGCHAGDCGACTVLLDGEQVCACITPVGQCVDRVVTTVEGLACDGQLNRLQQAFLAHGAAQCGICTPGMLMAATHLLEHNPHPTMQEIREGLSGNLCRCTGFIRIFESVIAAASQSKPGAYAR